MRKFENEFRKDHPETAGETDKEFDNHNYTEWLENKLGESISPNSDTHCTVCGKWNSETQTTPASQMCDCPPKKIHARAKFELVHANDELPTKVGVYVCKVVIHDDLVWRELKFKNGEFQGISKPYASVISWYMEIPALDTKESKAFLMLKQIHILDGVKQLTPIMYVHDAEEYSSIVNRENISRIKELDKENSEYKDIYHEEKILNQKLQSQYGEIQIFPNTEFPAVSPDDMNFSVDVITCDLDGLLNIGWYNFDQKKWSFHTETLVDFYEGGVLRKFTWMYANKSLIKEAQ